MRLRVLRCKLYSLLPCSFGTRPLTRLRIQIGQVQIGSIGILTAAQNAIEFSRFAERDHVAGVAFQGVFVLLKRLLPLFGLHVTEAKPAACCRVVWELSQCALILAGCLRPLAIPAVSVGCIDGRIKNLSVTRHERFAFSNDSTGFVCRQADLLSRATAFEQGDQRGHPYYTRIALFVVSLLRLL